MQIDFNIISWLVVWSIIGSTLGFFTIRFKPVWTKSQKILEYLLSVGVGLFFALPLFVVLQETCKFSPDMCIMLAGSSSFAITDLIIKVWPKIIEGIGYAINKHIDKTMNNPRDHE